jgi:hypothetical protein
MSIFQRFLDGLPATMLAQSFDLVWGEAQKFIPYLESLARGELIIPQEFVARHIDRTLAGFGGVEFVDVACCDGYLRVTVHYTRLMAKYCVESHVKVEDFALSRERRVATLLFSEVSNVQGRNLAGRLSSQLAALLFENPLDSEALHARISENTDGLVKVNWPRASIQLDAYPTVQKLNALSFAEYSFWDYVELSGCRIEPGRVVVNVTQLGLPRRQIEESREDPPVLPSPDEMVTEEQKE